MSDPIKKKRKKSLRNLDRNKSGRNATVKMEFYPNEPKREKGGKVNEKKKRNYAAPSITFKGKEKAKPQSFNQALAAGEMYEFKNKRKAERFAAGSWKKGKDKREAMKAYRQKRKLQKLNK